MSLTIVQLCQTVQIIHNIFECRAYIYLYSIYIERTLGIRIFRRFSDESLRNSVSSTYATASRVSNARRRLHHIAHATTSHVSLGRVHGGKSPRKIGGERASENEKCSSSTWIGSGAEKEFPPGTRHVWMRRSARTRSVRIVLYDNHEICTRSPPASPVRTPKTRGHPTSRWLSRELFR